MIKRRLDEEILDRPTPEVIVTNDQMTAAIEVKQLQGDETFQRYLEYQRSNERALAGTITGYYSLGPPAGTDFDIKPDLRRHLRKEIDRVGRSLSEGESGTIDVRREGRISLAPRESPYIHCCHHGPISSFWDPIRDVVTGYVMLVDCDGPNGTSGPDHSLHTYEGKISFYNTLTQAIRRREAGDTSKFSWNEEWTLTKHDDGGEPGVWLILGDTARNIIPSLSEAIQTLITKTEKKFQEEWADHNVFVLDSTFLGPEGLVQELASKEFVRAVSPPKKSPIHTFLLVEGGRLSKAETIEDPSI